MKAAIQGCLIALLVVGTAHLACGGRVVRAERFQNEQPQQPPPSAAQITSQQDVRSQFSMDALQSSSSTIGPLYRYEGTTGDHFYTTDATEIGVITPGHSAKNYRFERIEASIHTSYVQGSVPLYRFFDGRDHFYTVVGPSPPGGFHCEKVAGYCFPNDSVPGTIPLYRYYKPQNHFYTTDASEIGTTTRGTYGHHGYLSEGTECYVYSRCHVTNVRGSWQQWMTIVTPTIHRMAWGTAYTHETSKTEEWSWSVTRSVSAGFEAKGFSASVSVSQTIGQRVAETNSHAWSQSQNESISFNFTQAEVGKTAWQFVFEPFDTCGNTEMAKSQQLALTEGAWREPCCVPGWSLDARSNTRCYNTDSKISNDPACSVG